MRLRWPLLGIVVLALLLAGAKLTPTLVLDGPRGVLRLFEPADPELEYTPDFTRWKLLGVSRGDRERDVLERLGEPWFRQLDSRAGTVSWCYSRGRNVPRESCRGVVFVDARVAGLR